jgi:hypothetical protein
MNLNDQLLKFIFQDSQVDADIAASLVEAERRDKVTTKKTPLLKVLKDLGVDTADLTVDEDGCRATLKDAAAYHQAIKVLDSVEAMYALAAAGWVAGIAGDVADTTEPPAYTINFLCLDVAEPSKLDKPLTADRLNTAVKAGADTAPDQVVAEATAMLADCAVTEAAENDVAADEADDAAVADKAVRQKVARKLAGWTASDTTGAKHLGPLEFKVADEWVNFEVLELPDRLVFGGATNTGFSESGYILKEEGESTDETLRQLLDELFTYYTDGPEYTTRLVCNERM